MATSAQPIETKRAAPAGGLALAALLAVAGLAAWGYQLSAGMRVTGLGQQVVWGLYIAAFFTAVGAGAALLGLVGLSEFRPLVAEQARPRVLALALGAFIAGALLISMDVGNPLQLWRVITAFRFSSLMTWDFWLLVVAGVVALAYLLSIRAGRAQPLLGGLAILAALAVVVVEGWMLAAQAARPLWGSGLTVVTFLIGSITAGLSIGLLALPEASQLRPALAVALAASLVLVVAEVLTGLLAADARTLAETRLLLVGSAAPVFWFHLIVGLLLPLALLRTGMLVPAGALALLGVLAEKVWTLAAGQAEPWLALPPGRYFPSWVEFVAVIGVVAIGWLAYEGVLRLAARRAG